MNCDEARLMMHALIDGELDAGHARDIEAHLAACQRCAAELGQMRELRQLLSGASLGLKAPASLRRRIDAAIPAPEVRRPSRRLMLQGFALGTAMSAVAATGAVFLVVRQDQDQQVLGDVVSAHLRSLQADHLTDVPSTDQHTVKPWFNGRLDVAPPVADLTAQGFTLLGGRLDYIDGRAVAVIVYRRRVHVINLFVAQAGGAERAAARNETVQGFNVRRWTEQGLRLIAISDINVDELQEFSAKFAAATRTAG
jgi:mycothiol system anti-sigma-R factor